MTDLDLSADLGKLATLRERFDQEAVKFPDYRPKVDFLRLPEPPPVGPSIRRIVRRVWHDYVLCEDIGGEIKVTDPSRMDQLKKDDDAF